MEGIRISKHFATPVISVPRCPICDSEMTHKETKYDNPTDINKARYTYKCVEEVCCHEISSDKRYPRVDYEYDIDEELDE